MEFIQERFYSFGNLWGDKIYKRRYVAINWIIMIKKEHILPIGVLSRWKNEYSYDTFNYFINDYFNPTLQKKFTENNVYTDEELKILLCIYNGMKKYFGEHNDIWNMELNDDRANEIEKNIIKLLSLPSMERFMRVIRENPYYKWIWDFY